MDPDMTIEEFLSSSIKAKIVVVASHFIKNVKVNPSLPILTPNPRRKTIM